MSRRDDRTQPRVSTRFQPWERHNKTARLKGRQIGNRRKHNIISMDRFGETEGNAAYTFELFHSRDRHFF
jgi:hypothetical protein